jgi:hypothetical protein
MSTELLRATRPAGYWDRRCEWPVSSVPDAVTARSRARAVVAAGEPDPAAVPAAQPATRPVFASATARVEMVLGELIVNGLKHGGSPVTASLSRGERGWMLEVADPAVDAVPAPAGPGADPADPGGLGLRLTIALAEAVGWYTEGERKYVWAMVPDEPPARLLATLGGR